MKTQTVKTRPVAI